MAITEQNILRVTMNDTPYLLLRSPTHFHLIQVNSELTDKRFSRLLHIYPCSTKELEAMHLHVSAYKAENFTFIHLHKTHLDATLEMHRSLNQITCTVSLDYSDEYIRKFFEGYDVTIIVENSNRVPTSRKRPLSSFWAIMLSVSIRSGAISKG